MVANPLLDAALDYARRGWRVIPLHNLTSEGKCSCQIWRDEKRIGACPTPAKHPRFKGFMDLATVDPEQIRAWWRSMPAANVGIIGGKASGIWALDTDPRNGGDESRRSLIVKHEALPYTLTARTGGGGTHEYFQWPPDFDLPAMLVIDDGLEIVAEGHVIVAAPSYAHCPPKHPNGKPYAWEPELGPDEISPQPVPAWLLDLLRNAIAAKTPAPAAERKPGDFPLADIGKILRGCAWMAHCSDDAATLGEPEWYAQLSVLGRCVNGEQLAHELSKPHPEYSAGTTAEKLRRAIACSGPVTCAKVCHSLGGARFCGECPNSGKVKSPVVLGIRAERPEEPPTPDEPPPDRAAGDGEQDDAVTIDFEGEVRAVIEADDSEAALHLAVVLALVEDDILLGVLKKRLREHFKKRLSIRDLERAIRAKRNKRGAKSGGGGNQGHPEDPPNSGEEDWQRRLLRAQNGAPRANLANVITALRFAPEWQGVLWRDEFAQRTMALKKPPVDAPEGKWENLHDTFTADWLQHRGIDVSREIAGIAVEAVGYDRTYHPPRDYLISLQWDGTPRIDQWLRTYLGAELDSAAGERLNLKTIAQPSEYLSAVGAKWLISAVARVLDPGCKADCAIVLEGEQGKKKSSALDVMGGEWFTDQIEVLGSKDASMQIHGKWIIEIGELGSMTKADTDAVKTFMSRREERYRPPYTGRLVEVPRQCVFAGTVNPSGNGYLKDETGARRFWPVPCGKIDLDALRRDRDQLWAEARVRYDEGATWWLDVDEVIQQAEREQAARFGEDAWAELVREWLRYNLDDDETTPTKVLIDCLKVEVNRITVADGNRVARILGREGWRKTRISDGRGGRTYVYRPHTPAARLASAKQVSLV